MNSTPEDFSSLYPEQHGEFNSPFLGADQQMSPLDTLFPQHQQQPQQQQQQEPFSPASAVFNQNGSNTGVDSFLITEAPDSYKGFFDHMTPVAFDQGTFNSGAVNCGVSSSSLSSVSGPSAPSSAVGTPPTQNDNPVEWQPPIVLGSVSPDVQNDILGDYSYNYGYGNQLDEFSQYEAMQPKPFVDPSILHPEVRHLGITFPQPPLPPTLQQQNQNLQQQQQQQMQNQMYHQQNLMSFAISPGPSPSMQAGPSPSFKAGQSPSIKSGSISPFTTAASPFPQFSGPFLSTPTPSTMGAGIGSTSRIRHAPRESLGGANSIDLARSASHDGRSASRGSTSVTPAGVTPAGGEDSAAQSDDGNGDSKEKQQCPNPDCGRRFKDLRAHMLTHQNERPEKCPIQTCEYHTKGFARKYDKNRHTLTHYKGTMVCGFCPGTGSSAEKSFNRADVFKRHLTSVHGVEQTPPNSRRKQQQAPDSDLSDLAGLTTTGSGLTGTSLTATYMSSDATGKCSTCSQKFANAQDFYEHLDDCVLRIVQQEDPAEAVNESCLAEVENDQEVQATLEKNQVLHTGTSPMPDGGIVETEEDGEKLVQDEAFSTDEPMIAVEESPATNKGSTGSTIAGSGGLGSPSQRPASGTSSGKVTLSGGVQKSRGMTHSRGGVPFTGKVRSRRSRNNYPTSWGFDKGQMTMRKRVMAVFEGPRRLAKDDMMLSTEHEVRVPLSDGKSYVTDLDVQTLKRAVGFLSGTDEDKGPWVSDDPTEEQKNEMRRLQLQLQEQEQQQQQQQQLQLQPQMTGQVTAP